MDNPIQSVVHSQSNLATPTDAPPGDGLLTVSSLLDSLYESAEPLRVVSTSDVEVGHQNSLVQVRLGIASSLFTALRAKHGPTASHCLRVALHSSSWGQQINLGATSRDEVEVAALLHDIGKIGVPDCVLMKPAKLTREEMSTIERHRLIGQQILFSCCASQHILDIVKYAPAWYNGNRPGFDLRGNSLPLGARVVSILDAFDSMTSNQVYRNAMSRDQAVAELYKYSGTQFDPQLVEQFCDLLTADKITLDEELTNRWLRDLTPDASNHFWELMSPSKPGHISLDILFHQKLLNSMRDGVIFIDTNRRVLLWNRAAERLTGIFSNSVLQQRWTPRLLGMRGENGNDLGASDCPVAEVLSSRVQAVRRLKIRTHCKDELNVDAHLFPVLGSDGILHGATMLLHDASSRISLEQRVQTLHRKATRDPLTKVANRAEFDRVLAQFVATHLARQLPCSLIICDVDHFKHVNDTYGHPAGDEVLVKFAALLQRSHDPADLVARYGGEEFVMLCADCDNTRATQRANVIRQELSEMSHSSIGNRAITASFGVTEIQAGDTAMTMLRRADRALLQAKTAGRNRVVQLGSGTSHFCPPQRGPGWLTWLPWKDHSTLLEKTLVTSVPLTQATLRLRGFISDHHAKILSMEDNRLVLEFTTLSDGHTRRVSDRPTSLIVSLEFTEQPAQHSEQTQTANRHTLIHVSMHPKQTRERRRNRPLQRARQLSASLTSYFSAQEYQPPLALDPPATSPTIRSRFFRLFRSHDTDRGRP